MNFLIVSRISIPAKDRTLPCWQYLRSLGHTVIVEHPGDVPSNSRPDIIISMGVTIMDETFLALERFPKAALYCYNWDCYEWVWKNPRPGEYDYIRYGGLLQRAREVWVPSRCTGERTTQWWGLNNWAVILSACPWWEVEPGMIRDEGYALCCLREIPDPRWGMFEKACEELRIPYKMTMHEQTFEDYQKAVIGCRFLCAPLYELSTGGLSLMEGYYHGKPSLINNSKWNGARDYFGDRAVYFVDNDMANFKLKLKQMWEHPPQLIRDNCRKWITERFSDQRMVDDMLARIGETL